MSAFIDFAVETFINESVQEGQKPKMLRAFREETDEQLAVRIMTVMDSLEMAFAMKGNILVVDSQTKTENARHIVQELKKRLAPELLPVASA